MTLYLRLLAGLTSLKLNFAFSHFCAQAPLEVGECHHHAVRMEMGRRRIAGLVKILQDPNEFVLENRAVVSRIGGDRIFLDHARERTPRCATYGIHCRTRALTRVTPHGAER